MVWDEIYDSTHLLVSVYFTLYTAGNTSGRISGTELLYNGNVVLESTVHRIFSQLIISLIIVQIQCDCVVSHIYHFSVFINQLTTSFIQQEPRISYLTS